MEPGRNDDAISAMEASWSVALMRKLFMMAGLARPVNFMQEGGATVPPARKPARPKAE